MGPRGSALICGCTDYHIRLESGLADLKNKEDCLLRPTGFAAKRGLDGSFGKRWLSLGCWQNTFKVAIFSDAPNHASIIDGIRLAQRQKSVEIFIYRHCCTMRKKAVVTDSLFSMDGDFATMIELVKLRKEHDFLLVIDDVRVGQAIYTSGSLFNHSCQPNIHAYFLSCTLFIRTTEFVAAGVPLELSYGPQSSVVDCEKEKLKHLPNNITAGNMEPHLQLQIKHGLVSEDYRMQ